MATDVCQKTVKITSISQKKQKNQVFNFLTHSMQKKFGLCGKMPLLLHTTRARLFKELCCYLSLAIRSFVNDVEKKA